MAKEQVIGAYSAYAIAVEYGYIGTEEEWIKEQERNRKASEQAASDAESAKTAAEKAQKAAESSASSVAGFAAAAQESKEQAASSAAYAGEAQKAAESAKSAAAVSALLAQESAAQAAGSAESADSAKTAAAQSEQRTAASEANVAQAEERINKTVSGAVEAVAAQETKSVQAVAAEGERVLGTIPEDYTAAVGEIDELKKSKAEIDDTAIDGDTWSSKHIVDMLCPKIEKSGTVVQMDGLVEGYPLGVTASWKPAQEGSGDPSPENIRPIQGRTKVKVERREDDLAYTLTLPSTVYGGEVNAVTGEGQETWKLIALNVDDMDGTNEFPGWNNQAWMFDVLPPNTDDSLSEKILTSMIPSNILRGSTRYNGQLYWAANGETQSEYKEKHAGKSIQFCYKSKEPAPFTATGAQPLPAIAGLNTVLTDADSVTVTGRADPIQTVAKLNDRIAALEVSATNITE